MQSSWSSFLNHYACNCNLLLPEGLMLLALCGVADCALDRKVIHMPVRESLCSGCDTQQAPKVHGQSFKSSINPKPFHRPISLQRHHAWRDTGLPVGFLEQTPARVLKSTALVRGLAPTGARLQGEAVDLLAVHPRGPAHARRQVEAEARHQPRNAGVVQDPCQRLPYALPGAYAATDYSTGHHLTMVPMLLVRCAMAGKIAYQLQRQI